MYFKNLSTHLVISSLFIFWFQKYMLCLIIYEIQLNFNFFFQFGTVQFTVNVLKPIHYLVIHLKLWDHINLLDNLLSTKQNFIVLFSEQFNQIQEWIEMRYLISKHDKNRNPSKNEYKKSRTEVEVLSSKNSTSMAT